MKNKEVLDMSGWMGAQKILGRDKTNIYEISPETWISLIKEIYQQKILFEIPKLFKKIGDLMSEGHTHLPCKIPRGITKFDSGIGVNTLARTCCMERPEMRKEARPVEHLVYRYFLLLKGEGEMLEWGRWDIAYEYRACPSRESERRQNLTSSITKLTEGEVLEIFRERAGIPYYFCSLGISVHHYAEELGRQYSSAILLSGQLLGIQQRLYEGPR